MGYGEAWNWPSEEKERESEPQRENEDDPLSPVQRRQVAQVIMTFSRCLY